MAQDKKSFILYCDLIHTVEKMPLEKSGELFMHILRYVNDQNPVTEDLIINLTFEPIKQQLKRDLIKYQSIREKNKNNIKKRWNTVVYDGIPTDTKHTVNGTDNVTVTDTVSGNDSDNVIKRNKTFIIPDLTEIQAYCSERKNNVDSEKFFNHYESNGWKVGKNKMKDWKACVRTWEKSEFNKPITPIKKTVEEGNVW